MSAPFLLGLQTSLARSEEGSESAQSCTHFPPRIENSEAESEEAMSRLTQAKPTSLKRDKLSKTEQKKRTLLIMLGANRELKLQRACMLFVSCGTAQLHDNTLENLEEMETNSCLQNRINYQNQLKRIIQSLFEKASGPESFTGKLYQIFKNRSS